MGQQKYVYLVKDINDLEVNILSILCVLLFIWRYKRKREKKPSKRKGNTNDQVFFFKFYYGKGQILHKYREQYDDLSFT